jgi:hypothetical protein
VSGQSVPRRVQVAKERKIASAKVPSTVATIAKETKGKLRSATRLPAPSTGIGSHGESGESVPHPAAAESRSDQGHAKDHNLAETTAPTRIQPMHLNKVRLATPPLVQSTDIGSNGQHGAHVPAANRSLVVSAKTPNMVERTGAHPKAMSRRSKIVKLCLEMRLPFENRSVLPKMNV